jgi:uncharacterized protein YcnI
MWLGSAESRRSHGFELFNERSMVMNLRGPRMSAVLVTATGVLAALVLGAGAAWGHVVVQPSSLPKGASDAIFSFSTPNETTNGSNVTGLEVDFPTNTPLLSAYAQTKAGWTATVVTTKLAKPVTTDDGTITEAVSKITWIATAGGIPPNQFDLFTVSAGQLPSNTGSLEFKAIQTYSDGTSVSWIEDVVKGAPAPEHPAPILKLTGKAKKQ